MVSEKEYDFHLRVNQRALARLKLDLKFFLEEAGPIHLISITDRLKDYKSAIMKSQKMNIPVFDLDDLSGLRVVIGTLSEQKLVCSFFKEGLRGINHNVLKEKYISNANGYRAIHIVLEVPSEHTGTWEARKVEVQIQTVFQNSFNILSRSWLYKAEEVSDVKWISKFQNLSKKLEEIEQEVNELQIAHNSMAVNTSNNSPINPIAFQTIAHEIFGEECDEDSANWYNLYYRRVGYENCGQLRDFFESSLVHKAYQEFVSAKHINPEVISFFIESKINFWHMCGHNTEKALKLLETLKKS